MALSTNPHQNVSRDSFDLELPTKMRKEKGSQTYSPKKMVNKGDDLPWDRIR